VVQLDEPVRGCPRSELAHRNVVELGAYGRHRGDEPVEGSASASIERRIRAGLAQQRMEHRAAVVAMLEGEA